MVRLLRRLLYDPWREIDAEVEGPIEVAEPTGSTGKRRREAARPAAGPYDWRPLIVLVTVCVSLTLQEYVGDRQFFTEHFPSLAYGGEFSELARHAWWSGWRFAGYVLLPLLVIFFMPGERIRDYYLSFKNFRRHIGVYLLLFLLILPVVIAAPHVFPGFYLTYPFYKWANRSATDLWVWEALYALQFISLEFFFRGFMLKALRPRFGSGAIFVMVVPYCMIHYGKPMPETLGAIVAGIVLGTLAMRTRSIWGGVLIHIAVAITMDLMAVANCPPADSGEPCPDH
jgi:membrane protease YdiL (CAAX protease family)